MTALQTRQSSEAVVGGLDYFRLFQELESSGDIFEIDTSTLAVSVGPQSDLSDYCFTYFDNQSPDSVNELVIATNNPFVGRFDSLLSKEFPLAGKARITLTTRDLFDFNFIPNQWNAGGSTDTLIFIKPRVDIICYTSPIGTLAPLRTDRQYFFPSVTVSVGNVTWFMLPYYGRRYAHLNLVNRNRKAALPPTYQVTLWGVTFSQGTQQAVGSVTPGASKAGETQLGSPITVASNETKNIITTASTEGLYDYLLVEFQTSPPGTFGFDPDTSLRVTVSDFER